MNKFSITISFAACILFSLCTYAQNHAEEAVAKAREAIRMEDEEKNFGAAIALLTEAEKLDPQNIDYPYERAYAYIAQKEYKKASDILETLLTHKDVNPNVYQALGNAYDFQEMTDLALKTYENGIRKFPKSGALYLEMGNMKINKKDYNKALAYYEKGIKADPAFPSNYYWAAKLFCNSDERVWGMIYGELFMNLERNGRRTAEIGTLLFDTYKKAIEFTSDTSMGVSFSKNNTIDVSTLKNNRDLRLPYGVGIYEMTVMVAIIGEKTVDLNSLDNIRTRFVDAYFKGENGKKYPNILFDYQQKIRKAGYLSEYNHWVLMKGDDDAFDKWHTENKTRWDAFIKWFSENQIQVNEEHKFYRTQY